MHRNKAFQYLPFKQCWVHVWIDENTANLVVIDRSRAVYLFAGAKVYTTEFQPTFTLLQQKHLILQLLAAAHRPRRFIKRQFFCVAMSSSTVSPYHLNQNIAKININQNSFKT
jgi:hypothetical protein